MKRFLACAVIGLAISSAIPLAQGQPPTPTKPETLLKVDVALSRWQAEKKTSNLPFMLWMNLGGETTRTAAGSVRIGVDVPIGTRTTTSAQTAPGARVNESTTTTGTNTRTEYRNVGTSIDCYAMPLADGRFSINVRVEDSSIFSGQPNGRGTPRTVDPAAFRTFSLNNTLPMRDGQMAQFAVATDKVTGETLKVDVTINVVK